MVCIIHKLVEKCGHLWQFWVFVCFTYSCNEILQSLFAVCTFICSSVNYGLWTCYRYLYDMHVWCVCVRARVCVCVCVPS